MGDKPSEQAEQPDDLRYVAGDAVVERLGEITLSDGRRVIGCILSFPKGPPDLPLRIALDGSPIILQVRK